MADFVDVDDFWVETEAIDDVESHLGRLRSMKDILADILESAVEDGYESKFEERDLAKYLRTRKRAAQPHYKTPVSH